MKIIPGLSCGFCYVFESLRKLEVRYEVYFSGSFSLKVRFLGNRVEDACWPCKKVGLIRSINV